MDGPKVDLALNTSLSIYIELDDRKSVWMRVGVIFPSCWDSPLRFNGSAKYDSVSFMTTENFVSCGANGAAYFVKLSSSCKWKPINVLGN